MGHQCNFCVPDPESWGEFIDEIDERIDAAIRKYVDENRPFRGSTVVDAFNDLFRMGVEKNAGGGDPVYQDVAMPVAYALNYTIQRATSIVWYWDILHRIARGFNLRTVLDIGSGTDSTALALDAFIPANYAVHITCFEPSTSMRQFSELMPSRFRREYYNQTLEHFTKLHHEGLRFDLIVMSHALQYEHSSNGIEWYSDLAYAIRRTLNEGGSFIFCGARAKSLQALKLRRALERHRNLRVDNLEHGGPPHLARIGRYHANRLDKMRRLFVEQYGLHLSPQAEKRLFSGKGYQNIYVNHFQDQFGFAVRRE